jgi:hypothetical protein
MVMQVLQKKKQLLSTKILSFKKINFKKEKPQTTDLGYPNTLS